jgi:hypothetical protein
VKNIRLPSVVSLIFSMFFSTVYSAASDNATWPPAFTGTELHNSQFPIRRAGAVSGATTGPFESQMGQPGHFSTRNRRGYETAMVF